MFELIPSLLVESRKEFEEKLRLVEPHCQTVHVDIVFSPPWDPRTMASDEAKDTLGIF